MCWPNPSHASEFEKWILTLVDKTTPMPAVTQNVYQHALIKCQWVHKMHHYMCWQMHPMPVRTQNVSQNVMTKPLLCQRWQKMHHNMCWANGSHGKVAHKIYLNMRLSSPYSASEDTKCILTCLTKSFPCQQGLKIYHNMCSKNSSNEIDDTKCILTCVD